MDNTQNNVTLEKALRYLNLGFSVIPCSKNKKPLIPWQPYQHKLASEDEVQGWWDKYPDASVGIVTGKISGICVIDIDSAEGMAGIKEYLPDGLLTPSCQTPRGGMHLYFKMPDEDLRNNAGLIPGVDFRGEGGYVVAPPSVNGTGKGYSWLDGMAFNEVPLATLPDAYKNLLKNNSLHIRARGEDLGKGQDLTKPDNSLHFLTLGRRDDDLFHVGNCLIKGGCEPDRALQILEILANNCDPPFPEKEVQIKIKSVISRCERRERNLTEDLRKWIDLTSAYFSLTETYEPLQILTSQKNTVHQIMHRFVKDGYVERHPNKNGVYRRVDQSIEYMDFENADPNDTIDLRLPLDIHKKTKLFPKAVITLGGVSGMGKTLFALNTIRENMDLLSCFYFNSEMSPQQLKSKLSYFLTPMSEWVKRMKVIENWDFNSIADKIQADALNVVDYLEPEADRPYNIHSVISAIISKLNRGVALVAIQKKPGSKLATGGIYSIKASSLALSLDYGKIEIIKNRNKEVDPNPSLNTINFDVRHGYQIIAKGGWYGSDHLI